MEIPYAYLASVDFEKVTDYLLNLAHPDGAAKAKFFLALGYDVDNWQSLSEALRELLTFHANGSVVDPFTAESIL